MKLQQNDDLLAGVSLALVAVGVALVVHSLTEHIPLAVGMALIVFGVPAFFIVVAAAIEESK